MMAIRRHPLRPAAGGEYHHLALDWLLRDGTAFEESRELGANAPAPHRGMALPGSAYVGARNSACSVADIPWMSFGRSVHWRTSVPPTPGVTAAVCCVAVVAADAPKLDDPDDGSVTTVPSGFSPADATAEPHLPQPAGTVFAVDVIRKS